MSEDNKKPEKAAAERITRDLIHCGIILREEHTRAMEETIAEAYARQAAPQPTLTANTPWGFSGYLEVLPEKAQPRCPKCGGAKFSGPSYNHDRGIHVGCVDCRHVFMGLDFNDFAQFFPAPADEAVRALRDLVNVVCSADGMLDDSIYYDKWRDKYDIVRIVASAEHVLGGGKE